MTTQHVHDENCVFTAGAICGGTGRYYVAREHQHGAKSWSVVSRHRSQAAAVKAMAAAFAKNRRTNRADVLLCMDYYDPIQLCELVRR